MANQGAKKRKEENSRHINKLFRIIIACNVLYLSLSLYIYIHIEFQQLGFYKFVFLLLLYGVCIWFDCRLYIW